MRPLLCQTLEARRSTLVSGRLACAQVDKDPISESTSIVFCSTELTVECLRITLVQRWSETSTRYKVALIDEDGEKNATRVGCDWLLAADPHRVLGRNRVVRGDAAPQSKPHVVGFRRVLQSQSMCARVTLFPYILPQNSLKHPECGSVRCRLRC